jgi:phosphomethylpyrimidine synthase
MKISHDIRSEAQKEGLEKMAEKYKEKGKIYIDK